MDSQKLFILGEFYLKKGNFESARGIFKTLAAQSPDAFQYPYFLGKIEAAQENYVTAIGFLEKTRFLNPFHKQTLLLLTKCHIETNNDREALQCLVDAYLLCKETKDSRIEIYKKRIRNQAKKLAGMDDHQKNKLIKDRLRNLNERLKEFEAELRPTAPEESPTEDQLELPITAPSKVPSPELKIEEQSSPLMGNIEEVKTITSNQEHEPIAFPENAIEDDADEPTGVVLNANFRSSDSSTIDFTRHILFKSLSVQEIEKISKFSSIQHFAAGDRIREPLEAIYGFSCLLEGKVQLSHQGIDLLELHAGSIIDEAELCNGDKYFFESRALVPSTVLMINKAALMTLCRRKHELALHFLWHFYKSLTLKISAVLDNIGHLDVNQKMKSGLDQVWEIAHQRKVSALEIDFLSRKYSKVVKYKSNFLFKIQDPTEFFYILLEGSVELDRPENADRIAIESKEMISEMALVSNNFQHRFNAKVTSEQATLLRISRREFNQVDDPSDRDNYRMMEFLWNVFSKKYFEFVNFYFNLQK